MRVKSDSIHENVKIQYVFEELRTNNTSKKQIMSKNRKKHKYNHSNEGEQNRPQQNTS